LIGYLASKIAIRMLFRPLQPWHIFGIRMPMTPGVIPSRQRHLAVSIGELVSRHLLTSKDIAAAFAKKPFQGHLALLAERKVRELFARDFGPLPELTPHRFRSYFQVGVKTLKYQVGEGINNYLASREFEEKFTAAVADRLNDLGRQEIDTLLGAGTRQEIYLHIDTLIRSILFSERFVAWLAGRLAENLRQAAARGATINDLVPPQLSALVRSLLRKHAGSLLQRMGTQLADPALRDQVIKGILDGINHFFDGLGPVGAMAKGFLEADALERKIGVYLEEKEEGLVAWLGNPEIRERMVAVLEESIDVLLRKRLDALLADVDAQRLDSLCRECVSQIMAACRSERAMIGLRVLLHLGLEHVLDGGRRTLADCAAPFFPGQEERQLRETIVRQGLALLRSGAGERMIHATAHSMIDALLARPIGRLYDIVPHGVRQGLIEYLVLTTNRMLLQEAPGMVESLNLKRIVTDRVDSFNLLQLEQRLFSIIKKQCSSINLFGALLGFLIGLANLALAKLM